MSPYKCYTDRISSKLTEDKLIHFIKHVLRKLLNENTSSEDEPEPGYEMELEFDAARTADFLEKEKKSNAGVKPGSIFDGWINDVFPKVPSLKFLAKPDTERNDKGSETAIGADGSILPLDEEQKQLLKMEINRKMKIINAQQLDFRY